MNLFDRFINLSKSKINSHNLKLIAISCLFIACKIEEIFVRRVSDFAKFAENLFTCDEINVQEIEICKILKFNLCSPNLHSFAHAISIEWD